MSLCIAWTNVLGPMRWSWFYSYFFNFILFLRLFCGTFVVRITSRWYFSIIDLLIQVCNRWGTLNGYVYSLFTYVSVFTISKANKKLTWKPAALRRLTMVSSSWTLMGQYYKLLSVATTIRISNKLPIITQQVVAIFMTSLVTIATV